MVALRPFVLCLLHITRSRAMEQVTIDLRRHMRRAVGMCCTMPLVACCPCLARSKVYCPPYERLPELKDCLSCSRATPDCSIVAESCHCVRWTHRKKSHLERAIFCRFLPHDERTIRHCNKVREVLLCPTRYARLCRNTDRWSLTSGQLLLPNSVVDQSCRVLPADLCITHSLASKLQVPASRHIMGVSIHHKSNFHRPSPT